MSKSTIEDEHFVRQQTQQDFPSEVQNYRQLYFQAMRKVRQLSSIQNLLKGTIKTVNKIEMRDIVTEHEKNIMILQKQLKEKEQLYQHLQQQLRRQRQSYSEKEDYLKQKIQIQTRKKNVVIDQLDLMKGQMRICQKQISNLTKQNQKLQKIIQNYKLKQNQIQNNMNFNQTEQNTKTFNNYKLLIKKQQQQIYELKNQVQNLKLTIQQFISDKNKQTQKMKSLTQIHQIQNLSKLHIIKNLEKDLKIKENELKIKDKDLKIKEKQLKIKDKRIRQLQDCLSNGKKQTNNKLNQTKININNTYKSINDETKLIERMQNKLTSYEELIVSYEQNQKQIYSELINRDIQIEQFQEKQQQYLSKINQLQQLIQDLKSSYIHVQLQKNHIIEKYKKEQKSLKLSRFNNLSISKLTQTQNTTISDTSSTPTPSSSLNNSQIKFNVNHITDFDHNFSKQNILTKRKGNLTNNNKLNQIKHSFYKHKTSKTLNRKYSQVTPFSI